MINGITERKDMVIRFFWGLIKLPAMFLLKNLMTKDFRCAFLPKTEWLKEFGKTIKPRVLWGMKDGLFLDCAKTGKVMC